MTVLMSTISDSSQDASNTASGAGLSLVLPPNIFANSEVDDVPTSNILNENDILKPTISAEQSQKRRSSSRSIKRKKFDDELVESSLIKTSRPRPSIHNPSLPSMSLALAVSSPGLNTTLSTSSSIQPATEITPLVVLEKRKSRPTQKRIKKPKTSQPHIAKDAGRWKPSDDLSLILSVQQTMDLQSVYQGVKFSSKFSLREIQERWYALLYDVSISKSSLFAIKQLNPEVVAQIQAKVIFSLEEEKLISSIPPDKGTLECFQDLLDSNSTIFLPSRTAKVLYNHWNLMKQYNLLQQKIIRPPSCTDSILSYSDTEDLIDDSELQEAKDIDVEEETVQSNKKQMLEIKQLENQLPKWQVLVDCVTGVSLADFDSKTLAVLRGRVVRYLIQSREVSLGRSASNNVIDIDLSLEGPASKISRRQGYIRLDNSGDFHILNDGKKPIFVDGKPVQNGSRYKLSNNSVIEITVQRFIFIVNQEAILALKNKVN